MHRRLTRIRLRAGAVACASLLGSLAACAQQADFNPVGRQVAIMLQNSHFNRSSQSFGKMSGEFLQTYLRALDYGRNYFLQSDIDRFEREYGDQLSQMLIMQDSMRAARDIYDVFVTRVETRISQAFQMLEKGEFDMTADESAMRTRKDAPWPKDEAEAADIFRKQIKDAVLSEMLRREMVMKLAKEQHKEDLFQGERPPAEKIKLRYERYLHSVKDVDEEDVATMFLNAVARTFDPHTDYMSRKQMERFKDAMRNELVGIGAMLQAEEDGATKIMGIVVNGPADREGELKLNDRVVGVDSLNTGNPEDMIDITFMKIDKVVELIRGKDGTQVRLKVEPAGGIPGETKMIVITRARVELKDEQAYAQLIESRRENGEADRLGVIVLPSFYADFESGATRCSVDVKKLLVRLMEEKIDGLIIDLRGNGGGSLEEVRQMTGFFTKRQPVVQVKDTLGRIQVKESENRRPLYSGPLVILTDKSSASASEIMAGALQDENRAVIVGDSSTFGKGTVQQPMDVGSQMPFFANRNRAGSLKVTIQKFYRPSGASTQKKGVVPDLVLPDIMDALEVGEAYLDHALDYDVIRPAQGFEPLSRQLLFVPRLREESAKRVADSKDFSYIIEDVTKEQNRRRENKVSLNIDARRKELTDAEKTQDARNAERRERFAKMAAEDAKEFTFYRLRLDDVEAGKPLEVYNPSEKSDDYMRRAKDKTEELDTTPDWPSGLDPIKREGMKVLKNLVNITRDARLAGVLTAPEEQ